MKKGSGLNMFKDVNEVIEYLKLRQSNDKRCYDSQWSAGYKDGLSEAIVALLLLMKEGN